MKPLITPIGAMYIMTGVMNGLVALMLLVYALFPAAISVVAASSAMKEEEGAIPALVLMLASSVGLGVVGLLVGVLAIAYIADGVGIIRRRPWSRMFGVVLSIPVMTACIPFGTVIGILALVALVSKEGAAEFGAA